MKKGKEGEDLILQEKKVVIIGGSSGIGLATAKAAAGGEDDRPKVQVEDRKFDSSPGNDLSGNWDFVLRGIYQGGMKTWMSPSSSSTGTT